MKLLAVYVGTSAISQLNLQHGLQHGIWGFKDNAKPVDFETLEVGDVILLATGHSGGGPRTSAESWAEHSLASISYAKITKAPFKDMQPEWPDEPSLSEEERYYWRVRFDPASIKTIANISLKDSAKLSAELAENLRKSGSANGRGYVLDVSDFPAINLGKTNGKDNEAEIVRKLKARLEKGVPWTKDIEEYAVTFGKLEPTQVAQMENEQLWKLWTANKFAETGTPGLPRPTAEQWEGVRKMTHLLCDRTAVFGERFEAAREVYLQTFTAQQVQLPVILRTLLILEGGRFGTLVTKGYLNSVLQWTNKPEIDYRRPASITGALEGVSDVIEEWAAKVGARSLGDRASIPWHLCEILKETPADEINHWIFQDHPDVFDVDTYLKQQDDILWSVRQHRNEIHIGDHVLIWRAKVDSGVVAVCTVDSEPALQPDDAPDKWKKSRGEIDYRCRLKIDARFVDHPIARDAIKAALPNLSIIEQAAGTNFPIAAEEYATILSLKSVPPTVDPLVAILRRYHDEQIVFTSSENKRRYVVDSIDEDGVFVARLDGQKPERVTFAQAERLVQSVQAVGSMEFMALDDIAAVRDTVLQAESLALTPDQSTVAYLADQSSRLENFRQVLVGMNRVQPLYKPAMLLCVLDGLESSELSSNQFTFDWIAPRFIALMKTFGQPVTEKQAAQPFYHLSNDLFGCMLSRTGMTSWKAATRDLTLPAIKSNMPC